MLRLLFSAVQLNTVYEELFVPNAISSCRDVFYFNFTEALLRYVDDCIFIMN